MPRAGGHCVFALTLDGQRRETGYHDSVLSSDPLPLDVIS